MVKRLIAGLLLLSTSATAQVPSPFRREPPGEDVRVHLKPGEVAPFEGILFDNNTALRWAGYLEQALVLQELEKKERTKAIQLELDRVAGLTEIERKRHQETQRQLLWYQWRTSELEKKVLEPIPFYRTFWFGASLGVAATFATISGVYLLTR